jgi:hypothetical protein
MILQKCRNYFSNNQIELNNINEFDRTYKSSEAIIEFKSIKKTIC